MATVQMAYTKGGSLDGYGSGGTLAVTEATGGGAPAAHVELNIADGATREEVLKALDQFRLKTLRSTNLLT